MQSARGLWRRSGAGRVLEGSRKVAPQLAHGPRSTSFYLRSGPTLLLPTGSNRIGSDLAHASHCLFPPVLEQGALTPPWGTQLPGGFEMFRTRRQQKTRVFSGFLGVSLHPGTP
jgi:hypothetical protein